MLLVGLTGGIGSGKTTAARIFAELGAVVFDADNMAREVVQLGTRGYVAVVELFGSDVLLPGGELDRAALAKRVFSNDIERRELESVLHPEIFQTLRERLEPFRKTERIVVFDAALLIESGFDEECDMVISVEASEELRLNRVLAEGLRSEEDVRSRMAAQVSEEIRASRSDAVILNAGKQDGLREQVKRIWSELETRNKRVSGGV
jgi:dephospho-CoA kinase